MMGQSEKALAAGGMSPALAEPTPRSQFCTETFKQDLCKLSESRAGLVPCTLELFAGSCKLTKCLNSHGFSAIGIDHMKCKNRVGPCVVMDLTKTKSRDFLTQKIDGGAVFFIPMAPPCGTASRARDKPIPFRLRRLGVPSPKPLRSAQYPEGLPRIKGRDLLRVQLANACYETAAMIFQYGWQRGVIVFIENPTGSYMWLVPCIKALFEFAGVFFTTFHVCMHGGDRDKRTSLLHNCPELCALALRRDKQHKHKDWSVSKSLDGKWQYDTSSEAEYPLLLTQRIAAIVSKVAVRRGLPINLEPRGPVVVQKSSNTWKVAAGRQPRGRRAPNLLPEDGQIVRLTLQEPVAKRLCVWSGRSEGPTTTIAGRVFPNNSPDQHVAVRY